jgi:nucleolar protein involved in exit from mitosis
LQRELEARKRMDAELRIKLKQDKREETIERQRNELLDKIKRGEDKM